MTLSRTFRSAFAALACLAALALASSARAQLIFDVSLSTASLAGHVAGPFSLYFQFTDGSGLDGDGNNSVTISNFDFGGGSATGAATATGGFSGDLFSSVTLTDTSFISEFYQTFEAGSTLSFRVELSTNVAGAAPDSFVFGLLDSTLAPLPMLSYDTHGVDSLLMVAIDGSAPLIETFASDTSLPPWAGGEAIDIAAPTAVPVGLGAVPEPSTYGLFAALGLLGVVAWRRARRS